MEGAYRRAPTRTWKAQRSGPFALGQKDSFNPRILEWLIKTKAAGLAARKGRKRAGDGKQRELPAETTEKATAGQE